jgi:polysaccharide export outer membrane protein
MRHARVLCVALFCLGCGPRQIATTEPASDLMLPAEDEFVEDSATGVQTTAAPQPERIESIPLPARPAPYKIRTGDILTISVLGEPDLTRTLPVGPDGRLSYYVAHSVVAAGRTFEELRADLGERLKIHFKNPQVTVFGQEYKGNTASVLGLVGKPGQYVVRSDTRLLDLIALAGGIAGRYALGSSSELELADMRHAYLLRGDQFVDVDFERLFSSDHTSVATNNVPVLAGDRLYVPSASSLENKVFVLGEVARPQVFRFQRDVSLLEAIAEAGGVKATARERKAFVVRGSLKRPAVIPVDLRQVTVGAVPDVALRSGDIVFVPKTALGKIEEVARQVFPLLQDATEIKSLGGF